MVTTIANVRKANPKLQFLGMVPSKVDAGNPRHGRHLDELERAYPQLMIPAGVGLRSNIADALVSGVPVWKIKKTAARKAAKEVRALAAHVNKIPLAMAEVLADRLGLDVDLGIVQRDKVGRTGAGSDHRLAFNPSFEGDVKAGQDYLVVDDTLTMGGTIASLRGYVENHGGKVVAAAVMTAHEGAVDLAVKPKMLAGIAEKHGPMMNEFWQETFGYGIDKLTQGEAGHLRAAPTVDAIRDRITAARHEGIERLDAARASALPRQAQGPPGAAVSQVMRELMRGYIEQRRQAREYDEYLRRKVEAGRASMRAGVGRSNDEVEAAFAARRNQAAAGQTR